MRRMRSFIWIFYGCLTWRLLLAQNIAGLERTHGRILFPSGFPTPAPSITTPTSNTAAPTVEQTTTVATPSPSTIGPSPTPAPISPRDLLLKFTITNRLSSTFSEDDQNSLIQATATLAGVPIESVEISSYNDVTVSSIPAGSRRINVQVVEVSEYVTASSVAAISSATLSDMTGLDIANYTVTEVTIVDSNSSDSPAVWVIALTCAAGALIGFVCVYYLCKGRENRKKRPKLSTLPQHVSTKFKIDNVFALDSPDNTAPASNVPTNEISNANMYFSMQHLDGNGYVTKYRLLYRKKDLPVTWEAVLIMLEEDDQLADLLTNTLTKSIHKAFFFEVIPVSASLTAMTPFEFTLTHAPKLATAQPDPKQFEKYLGVSRSLDVKSFQNLGGDATLISPCCGTERRFYGHLAAFLRGAPQNQVRLMWKTVGSEMEKRLQARSGPVWLSTSGEGVPWLHYRICDSSKYYTYDPYRKFRSVAAVV